MVTASSCPGPRPTLRAMAQDKGPLKETLGRKGRTRRLVLEAGSRCGLRSEESQDLGWEGEAGFSAGNGHGEDGTRL